MYIDAQMVWRKAILPRHREPEAISGAGVGSRDITGCPLLPDYSDCVSAGCNASLLCVFGAFGISAFFALTVFGLRAATGAGAACGAMVLSPVNHLDRLVLRLTAANRIKSPDLAIVYSYVCRHTDGQAAKKTTAGLAEAKSGRKASQVTFANLGIPAVSSSLMGVGVLYWAGDCHIRCPCVSSVPLLWLHWRRLQPTYGLIGDRTGIRRSSSLVDDPAKSRARNRRSRESWMGTAAGGRCRGGVTSLGGMVGLCGSGTR